MVQGERKLIDQAEELVVLVDSSKFAQRSSLILCGLDRVHTIVTDEGIEDGVAAMLQEAGVRLIVAERLPAREALKLSQPA
jgi:DeoR family ulaG and ulaABCDEF operon transcriptional repressor